MIGPLFVMLTIIILVSYFISSAIIAMWIYHDAKIRFPEESSIPLLWLIIVLFTGIIGLIIYLIVRPEE